MKDFMYVIGAIALSVVCWGSYGPILHKGSTAMAGDRWRAFLCVGIAYFIIAVVVPLVILYTRDQPGVWSGSGAMWSLGGGAAGAIGALGIILAFNFGGKPGYVMPLVFGCAPVVNAFLAIYLAGTWKDVSPMFLAGLVIVALGAAMVLFFAPRGGHAPSHAASDHAAASESSEGQ